MSEDRKARLLHSLSEISKEEWDACANPASLPYNPFLSHDFLWSMEESGSACAETGWAPCHLVLEDDEDNILGVVPMYLKSHSQGEYVFDHSWAHALERAGGSTTQNSKCLFPSHRRQVGAFSFAIVQQRTLKGTWSTGLFRRPNRSTFPPCT